MSVSLLAEPLVSPEDLPPFRRSLMDGYAVRAGDTTGAAPESPRWLTVVADVTRLGAATVLG